MAYTIDRFFGATDIDTVEIRMRAALAKEGFGILSEIDVKATLKNKIGKDIEPYRILGACNPEMAFRAIDAEARIGAMLPCNVILRSVNYGVEVHAVDPVASMQAIDNPALKHVATQVRDLLEAVVQTA